MTLGDWLGGHLSRMNNGSMGRTFHRQKKKYQITSTRMSGTPISQRIIALNICFLLPVENPTFLMNDCSIGQEECGAAV